MTLFFNFYGKLLFVCAIWLSTEAAAVRRNTYSGDLKYPVDKNGHCPVLMELYEKTSEGEVGECRCKNLGIGQRPIVYWKETNRCYFAYDQGPCASGEWLVGKGHINVSCKKHKCPVKPLANNEEDSEHQSIKPDKQFYVQRADGACFETNTEAFCPSKQILFLNPNGLTPECYDVNNEGDPIPKPLAIAIGRTVMVSTTAQQLCAEGYKWDEAGKCVKIVVFD